MAHQKAKTNLEEQLNGKFGEQITELFDNLDEDTEKVREENENLKLQIEKLKAEVKALQEKTQ